MKHYLLVILLFGSLLVHANRVKVKIFPVLKTSPAELVGNETELSAFWKQQNLVLQKIQAEFNSRRQEIADKIGSNQGVEVVTDAAPTMINFELVFALQCIPDIRTDDKGNVIESALKYRFTIDLIDAHTKGIVNIYDYDGNSDVSLPAEQQIQSALKLLVSDKLPAVDQIENDIRNKADYHDAKIRYDQNNQVANGENKGRITVSGIDKKVIGEAKSNPISAFTLKAEKGIFLKTNSHEVRFEGNEYYYGEPNSISFDYKTYKCSDYDDDKSEDTFTLTQVGQFNEKIEKEVVVTDIPFTCGTYDIYAHYFCTGLADVEVVWRNVEIVIPDDESDIPVLNAATYDENADTTISIPYAVNIPGYGKEIFYSYTESDIPEEIKINSLSDTFRFWIEKADDNLNSCRIEKTPGGAIQLILQFDLFLGEKPGDGVQCTVGTDSDYPNHYSFPWMKIDSGIIEQLKRGDTARKNLTNPLGGKLTIRFEPN